VTSRTPTSSEHAKLDPSLTALTLLADPVSALLEPPKVARLCRIAGGQRRSARSELLFLGDCWRALKSLRASLKCALTAAYEIGAIESGTVQLVIDHFELWSD
jgi:hypothetical protein